jgi:hypothetical protein
MVVDSKGWPGAGTILNPRREPQSFVARNDLATVTYAHLAFDSSNRLQSVTWESSSMIQELGIEPEVKAKIVQFSSDSDPSLAAGTLSQSWRGLPLGFASTKVGDIVKINTSISGYFPGILFAIVPRSRAIDLGSSDNPNENGRGAYRGFLDRTSNEDAAANNLAGIKIKTHPLGADDLILPSGPGQYLWFYSGIIPVAYKKGTAVDREPTLVNVGSGRDVVIGGYGKDHFGAYTFKEIQELKKKARKGEYALHSDPASKASGSKFFVGGSYRDFLVGGSEQDYLIGDRYNGYELYLPTAALGNPPPSSTSTFSLFDRHFAQVRRYQPAYFADAQNRGKDKISVASGGSQQITRESSLWIPGSDVIFSYSGDDIIYGDDNTIFGASGGGGDLVNLRKFIDNVSSGQKAAGAYSRDKWLTKKLAADFIDAGEGDDQIFAGIGGDAIIGGPGSDVIYIGDQIIAGDYDPFWGTKVVYGDSVTGGVKAPDVFFVGELLETEAQIAGRTAAATVGSAQVVDQRNNFLNFTDSWEGNQKLVYLIPKVGATVVTLVNAAQQLYKLFSPEAPAKSTAVPQAADALVVIKDFDSSDQLSLRVPQGGIWETEYQENWGAVAGTNPNPLIGTPSGRGTMIRVSGQNTPGTLFNRVFLEGYREGLVSLKQDTNDGVVVYGGADYYLRNRETGALVFSELFDRDTASNNPLGRLDAQLVSNPF